MASLSGFLLRNYVLTNCILFSSSRIFEAENTTIGLQGGEVEFGCCEDAVALLAKSAEFPALLPPRAWWCVVIAVVTITALDYLSTNVFDTDTSTTNKQFAVVTRTSCMYSMSSVLGVWSTTEYRGLNTAGLSLLELTFDSLTSKALRFEYSFSVFFCPSKFHSNFYNLKPFKRNE